VAFLTLGGLYFLLAVVIQPKKIHGLARLGCRGILLAAGIRVRLTGQFPARTEGPYVYVFNHTSLLDTFVTIAVIPEYTSAIGKAEQFRVPLWGWILNRWGAIPIDRRQLSAAKNSLAIVEDALRGGASLLISPEGTRSADGHLQPFKKGPFHVAVNARAKIVPLIIHGAFRLKNKTRWTLRPGIISVDVAPPLSDHIGKTHTDALDATQSVFKQRLRADER